MPPRIMYRLLSRSDQPHSYHKDFFFFPDGGRAAIEPQGRKRSSSSADMAYGECRIPTSFWRVIAAHGRRAWRSSRTPSGLTRKKNVSKRGPRAHGGRGRRFTSPLTSKKTDAFHPSILFHPSVHSHHSFTYPQSFIQSSSPIDLKSPRRTSSIIAVSAHLLAWPVSSPRFLDLLFTKISSRFPSSWGSRTPKDYQPSSRKTDRTLSSAKCWTGKFCFNYLYSVVV